MFTIALYLIALYLMQDQNGFTRSLVSPPVGSGVVSLSSGSHSATHIQLDDPLSCGNDYALKVHHRLLCICVTGIYK